jgi:spore coat polysaccharide biosynthesis predicted glycosyltransferase SpsG
MSRVVFCCDAGATLGIGHVMRCIALAEELAARGVECVFVADLGDLPWARDQVISRGLAVRAPGADGEDLVDLVLAEKPVGVVVDSYRLPPAVTIGLRAAGVPVTAIIDGEARGQSGDLYIDQNLDAEHRPGPAGAPRLAGLDYALLRSEVVGRRPAEPPRGLRHHPPRVLAYFGGTDPYGASPAVIGALARSGETFAATVVAPRPELRAALATLPLAGGQELDVIGPTSELMTLAADADLVISAAGTSLWELLCIGSAAAVVWVVDNQELGYARVVASGTAAGLGHLDDVRSDPLVAAEALGVLLRDVAQRDRLRSAGWASVDGRGRIRVADAILATTTATDTATAADTATDTRSGPVEPA